MNVCKACLCLLTFFFLTSNSRAQDTLRLGKMECEGIFLRENLSLMAEKLNIPQAEAMVQQAKLWPNPSLTLDQVNLWATKRQTLGQEVSPPLFGNFGRNQQFAIEIEQLIQTAGKRKKLIALEQVSVAQSEQYFEDLLRNLKLEFRKQLTQLQYLQFNKRIFQQQLGSIGELTQAYEQQVSHGNVPKGEYIRLKAQQLEIAKNINVLNKEANEAQKQLKLLMHLPPDSELIIKDEGFSKQLGSADTLGLNKLLSKANENRPDLKLSKLEEDYYHKLYTYEKAQRVPDFSLIGSYDRNGSTMLDFVGFGVAMDLPIFNRNQGKIKHAQLAQAKANLLAQQSTHSIANEIALSYQNFLNAINFRQGISADYESDLDKLLISYTENFKNRNIGMLEYLDFMDAYLDNKKTILDAIKEVNDMAEELNYAVGNDVVK